MFWNSMTSARMHGSTAPNLDFSPSRIIANFSTSKLPTPSYQPGLVIPSGLNADSKWVCPAIGCNITRAKKSSLGDHTNAHGGVDDEEGEDDEQEMLPAPAIPRSTQYGQSMVGPSTRTDMMGGSFPDGSVTGRMNVPGIGAPSMSSAMVVGESTEPQSGAAPVQSEGPTKTKKQLDAGRAFGNVLEAYNNYSTLNVGKDGLRTHLRKTALNLLSAVHAEEMEEEEDDDVI